MDRTQDLLYDQLAEQLTQLGVHDAAGVADRMKLELDPADPLPHPVSLLHLAQTLSVGPMGVQDGCGDLAWRIEPRKEETHPETCLGLIAQRQHRAVGCVLAHAVAPGTRHDP